MKKSMGLIFVALLHSKASAAPTPPEILPSKFPREIQGYNIQTAYGNFAYALQYQYPKSLKLKAEESERNSGPRITIHTDWVRNSVAFQYHRNCDDDCLWEVTKYQIDSDYFSKLAETHFDPHATVEDMKAVGILPGDEYDHTPKISQEVLDLLLANVESNTVTETTCKSIEKSLEELEGLQLPAFDIEGFGLDKKGKQTIVHSFAVEFDIPVLDRKLSNYRSTIKFWGYSGYSFAGKLFIDIHNHIEDCFPQ